MTITFRLYACNRESDWLETDEVETYKDVSKVMFDNSENVIVIFKDGNKMTYSNREYDVFNIEEDD